MIPTLPMVPLIAMVELVFIMFVAGTAFLVWVVSRAPDVPPDPAAEIERLQQYIHWLKDSWHHAEVQNYDDDMKARIRDELQSAIAQLAALRKQAGLEMKAAA